jgi:hypothetical protein
MNVVGGGVNLQKHARQLPIQNSTFANQPTAPSDPLPARRVDSFPGVLAKEVPPPLRKSPPGAAGDPWRRVKGGTQRLASVLAFSRDIHCRI